MSGKMYKIVCLSVDGETDYDVGVCETKDLADRIADGLNRQNADRQAHWESSASKCICNCECWDNPDEEGALNALNEMEKFECPHKKNVHIGELIIGGKSGGYEIWCDGRSERCECPWDESFVVEEITVLDEDYFKSIAVSETNHNGESINGK